MYFNSFKASSDETREGMELIEIAWQKAKEILRGNISPYGLMASAAGYRQVWARDLGISALGAVLLDDEAITQSLLTSLRTLKEYQADSGAIPILVSASDPPVVKYGAANCSGIDAPMWYILTLYYLWKSGKISRADIDEFKESLGKTVYWLRCQDSNEDYLLETPENSDWRDLWFYRHHVLYNDVLYFAAQRAVEEFREYFSFNIPISSRETKKAVNLFYRVSLENFEVIRELDRTNTLSTTQMSELYAYITGLLARYPYYLPYVALCDFGYECDVVGNLLAIFFGVADEQQREMILDYLEQCGAADPYPIAVLDKPVEPTDRRWSPWCAKCHLNLPYQYHNGGIWPFVGGFYVAALVIAGRMREAEYHLERLAEGCKKGKKSEWEFNEWLNKQTGKPMGSPQQLWSAAMYCLAYRAVKDKTIPVFKEWI